LLFIGAGFFGADTLKDLSLALFVGLAASTYSSIFVATPVLAMLKEREPRYRNVREKLARDIARRTEAAEPALAGVEGSAVPADAAPRTPARPSARPSAAAARARAGSKKAKRRKRR
jgi:preprotein translocase subunit SecF